jgi:hypothetical protein
MAQDSRVEAKLQATGDPQHSATPKESLSVSFNMSQAVNICAAGLLICFFLPWIDVFLGKPSGFDFAKHEGGRALLFWSIPIFCGLTILANITKRSPKIVAQLTGTLPFAVLTYGLYHVGKDLMQLLEVGAYAGLALGLLLFILARQLK